MKEKISVIVPVYGVEKVLRRCVDSILAQTYENIEIILVDDGSPDGCPALCDAYARQHDNIVAVHKKNGGLTSAWKEGVRHASAELVGFVDSDDWIAVNLIESMQELLSDESIDIVNYNMKSVEGGRETKWHYTVPEGVYEGQRLENVYTKMMFDFEYGRPGIIQSLCTKLMKRKILLRSMEGVDSRIAMGDDAAVVYKAMLIADKVAVTHQCFYFYRIHSESLCHTKEEHAFFKIECFQKYMRSIFLVYSKKYQLDEQLKFYLMSFIRKGVEDYYGLKLRDLYHIPFQTSDLRGKLILYGAGSVGKSYYRQLVQLDSVKLVFWVDQGLAGKQIYGCKIESPTVLNHAEFDRVLIAVKDKNIAEEIRQQLSVQIPDKKILWDAPRINWWERELDI